MAPLCRRGRWDSHHDLLHIVLLDKRQYVVSPSRHLDAMDAGSLLRRIVVGCDNRDTRHIGIFGGHARNGEGSRLARPDDQGSRTLHLGRSAHRVLTSQNAPDHAHAAHDEHKQYRRCNEHANRQAHVDNP